MEKLQCWLIIDRSTCTIRQKRQDRNRKKEEEVWGREEGDREREEEEDREKEGDREREEKAEGRGISNQKSRPYKNQREKPTGHHHSSLFGSGAQLSSNSPNLWGGEGLLTTLCRLIALI